MSEELQTAIDRADNSFSSKMAVVTKKTLIHDGEVLAAAVCSLRAAMVRLEDAEKVWEKTAHDINVRANEDTRKMYAALDSLAELRKRMGVVLGVCGDIATLTFSQPRGELYGFIWRLTQKALASPPSPAPVDQPEICESPECAVKHTHATTDCAPVESKPKEESK